MLPSRFVSLFQHRFASHVCETLFSKSALLVTQEMGKPANLFTTDGSEPLPPMEDFFLSAAAEIQEYLGYLLTHQFATHPIRILLLILAGQPIETHAAKTGLHSKKKEHVTVSGEHLHDPALLQPREVPQSFIDSLQSIIAASVADSETHNIRGLASHPRGNPMLQLLLRLELTSFGKQRAKEDTSILHILMPESNITADSDSASFINGLLFDVLGSRLLETILEYAPSKVFKAIYKSFIVSRLPTIAKNDIASYVASKAFTRLSKEDLEQAMHILVPELPTLLSRHRYTILRTLIDRSQIRGSNLSPLSAAFSAHYSSSTSPFDLTRLLPPTILDTPKPPPHILHASLLAQSMLSAPSPLCDLMTSALSALPKPLFPQLARAPHYAHLLSHALEQPHLDAKDRRMLIVPLQGHFATLALDPTASHVLMAIWRGSANLFYLRERVAQELAEAEGSLRESMVGRRVWRMWDMDTYQRRNAQWVQKAKGAHDGKSDRFGAFPDEKGESENHSAKKHRSRLDEARERFARKKMKEQEAMQKGKGREVVV